MATPPRVYLVSLPTELIDDIGARLTSIDYANLRLTCRLIDAITFPYFARKYFHCRRFCRAPTSLAALLQIAHSRLAPYLEHFILGTEILNHYANSKTWVFRGCSKTAYLAAINDQTSLLGSGYGHDILAEAFGHLPNLRIVEVAELDEFNSRSARDATLYGQQLTNTQSFGYGLKTLFNIIGDKDPIMESSVMDRLYMYDVNYQTALSVQMLLGALARSHPQPARPQVLRLRCCQKRSNSDWNGAADDCVFQISPFLRDSVAAVVAALEVLDLDIFPNEGGLRFLPHEVCLPGFRNWNLRKFLSLPKYLHTLRIHCATSEVPESIWTWLAARPVVQIEERVEPGTMIPTPIPSPALSYLRELLLDHVRIQEMDLLQLIQKVSPTIEKLTLSDMAIFAGSHPGSLLCWADICDKMAAPTTSTITTTSPSANTGACTGTDTRTTICEHLCEVHLLALTGLYKSLLEGWPRFDGQTVLFSQARQLGPWANLSFSYRGSRAKEALGELGKILREAFQRT